MLRVLEDSIRKTVAVALLTAAATTLGTKLIEFAFEKLNPKDNKKPEDEKKLILPK